VTKVRIRAKRGVARAGTWEGSVTVTLILIALVVGIAGLVTDPTVDFHLTVETLAIGAALTGVFWERRFAKGDRRRAAIAAITDELTGSVTSLEEDPRFKPQDRANPVPRVYPRIEVNAVSDALAQAAFGADDRHLSDELKLWKKEAQMFNQALGMIEVVCYMAVFTKDGADPVIMNADHQLQSKRVAIVEKTKTTLSKIADVTHGDQGEFLGHLADTSAAAEPPLAV
jgi:hypothetical protein